MRIDYTFGPADWNRSQIAIYLIIANESNMMRGDMMRDGGTTPIRAKKENDFLLKKNESRLCRLVFCWSPSFNIRSIKGDIHHKDPMISFC